MKKFLAILLIAGLILSLSLVGCKSEKGTIKIGAILAVTGGASFLGAPEAKTVEMVVEEINSSGGINGMQIELIIKDSAANPEKAISFAKQLIEEDNVVAIIGPSTSGETMQIKDICESYKVPLVSCAAAEAIVNPVAEYVFKTPQKDSYVAKWIYSTMNSMGIKKIAVIAANTGFGNAGKGQLEKCASEFGIEIAIAETYDKAATDLTALLTKINAKDVEAVVNWSIVPAQSIAAKNMKQLGMDQPLFQSHGFGNIKYVEAAGEAADGIIFPAGRLLVAEKLPDGHPQKKNLTAYKTAYESKYNEDVSTLTSGYSLFFKNSINSFLKVIEALKKADSTERDDIRNALESISGFPGTGGIFSFSSTDHNGLGMDSLEMLTVKNGEFDFLNN